MTNLLNGGIGDKMWNAISDAIQWLSELWRWFWSTFIELWQNNSDFRLIMLAFIALIVFVIISYILLRKSRDRCIKDFGGYHVEAILTSGKEGDTAIYAYSGVLEVPIQAGNGFEVNYDLEAIDNLSQLISYLRTAQMFTGNEKYSRAAERIRSLLKSRGQVDVDSDYVLNPFERPPEASHKVYSKDLDRLLCIVRFFKELPDIEMKARLVAWEKFFHPGFLRRTSRSLGNFIAFAWDRVKQIATMVTGYFTKGRSEEMQKIATEARTTAFTYTPSKYEALLENSIGMLVKIKVLSPDGKFREYRGVLKEYSDTHLCIYNIFYRLPRAAEYERGQFKGLDPKFSFIVKGKPVTRDQDIEVMINEPDKAAFSNISENYLLLTQVNVDGEPIPGFPKTIEPSGEISVALPENALNIRVEYEEAFAADAVFPRRLALVVGRSEPKLPKLQQIREGAAKVKDIEPTDVYRFFDINYYGEKFGNQRTRSGDEAPVSPPQSERD